MRARDYLVRSFRVPSERVDEASALLWSAGSLGVEVKACDGEATCRLVAYWPGDDDSEAGLIRGPMRELGVELLDETRLAERDWHEPFRRRTEPFPIASRFWVDPGEPEPGVARPPQQPGRGRDRFALRLPARRAFGIGSHATTRLMMAGLEQLPLDGRCVLDLGAGTGILSFAALLLGARWVVGVDNDRDSVPVAAENRRLNGLRPSLVGGTVNCLDSRFRFDVVLVNVLPDRIAADVGQICSRTARDGDLLVSGLLFEEHEREVERWQRHGMTVEEVTRCEEWAALRMRRDPR